MGKRRLSLELCLCTVIMILLLIIVVMTFTIILLIARQSYRHHRPVLLEPIRVDTTTTTTTATTIIDHDLMRADIHQQSTISEQLIKSFVPYNIRDNLRWLSKSMHVAGTVENAQLIRRLADQYRSYGMDVHLHDYQVLLSYPDYDRPNTIEAIIDDATAPVLLSNGLAERLVPLSSDDDDRRELVWWNAYSADGNCTAPIVYVNYGRADDYLQLDRMNISIDGKIVLARYGAVWRGAKVREAERRGAIGMIIYSDPIDYANSLPANETFPHTIWLPPSAAQRGSLKEANGDPETTYYPSKPYAYRSIDDQLPTIPVTPIGYRDAIKIFAHMDGDEVGESHWKGAMNVTYRLMSRARFRLVVHSIRDRRTITNMIAYFRGRDEPDRLVMFGNHVDSWVNGAIDPNSATATLLEMARVLSSVSNATGWRPRRSIAFCAWDAEEFGLIGSNEWVEEHLKLLQARAIALINVDNISGNVTLSANGVPLLYRALVDAARRIDSPNDHEHLHGRRSLFDSWNFYYPRGPIPGDKSVPTVGMPGTGSDHQRFISYAGVPILNLHFLCAPVYCYTIYHSMYETAWAVEHLLDRNFQTATAVGRLWLELGRNLADSIVIPFNVHDYGIVLADYGKKLTTQLRAIGFADRFDDFDRIIGELRGAMFRFQIVADALQQHVSAANSGAVTITHRQANALNDRLMSIERAFIDDYGIYRERATYRHVIYSVSAHDSYSGSPFACIIDPAVNWRRCIDESNATGADYWMRSTRIGFTKLQYAIESAVHLLRLDDNTF